jgi:two-component system, NtrC family, sensor histidine kinase HydH
MARRRLLLVLAVLAVVIAGLERVGTRMLETDRREMYASYADDRMHRLEAAALDLGNDVEKIGQDLELAAALATRTVSTEVFERELTAIAAITREYAAIDVQDAGGASIVRVVAADAPTPTILTDASNAIDSVIAAARATPGSMKTSRPLGSGDQPLAWVRVFARQSPENGVVVAIVVDMRPLLAKLRLLSDDTSALLVIGAHGTPAPTSHPVLAEAVRTLSDHRPELPRLSQLMAAIEERHAASVVVGEAEARRLGLPSAAAVAVAVPVVIEDGEPWALALVSSTAALKSQERRLVRRVWIGGAFAIGLLVALSAYFIRNARRAATLQERVRHADRLAHLTEKAEKILDHVPSGVLALGEDRAVTANNRWLAERLGRDVTGATLAEVFADAPATELARVECLIDEAIASAAPSSIHRARLSLLGEERDLSLHAIPLERRLADVHVLLVVEDDTPIRRLEDRLVHSEKLATAGQLAAGIAHEIGTPLNIARGRAELGASKLGEQHPQAAGLRIIVDQIDHVSRLIEQLLDYVRPRASVVETVDPTVAILATSELLTPEATKRGVTVETAVAPDTPALRADPGQLRQVLVNLAMNALDACETGGHVAIRAMPDSTRDAVVLEVQDDGVGIAPTHRAQVFDPFFTTKKRGKGTGLGLWVVAQLVRNHDAEIDLSSEPGSGTTIRVVWPASKASLAAS